MNAPLILILAASIGSAPVTPGSLATAARTRGDSENGATTSRLVCLRPRSGATLPDFADWGDPAAWVPALGLLPGRLRAAGRCCGLLPAPARRAGAALGLRTLATGTARGVPLPSAFPPSIGTTGPLLLVGAGRDCGAGRAWLLTSAELPPAVASTTPVVVPASASTLITTGMVRP